MLKTKADIGVFGGSGFYSFLENVSEIEIDTPYGKPSDKIMLAEISGKKIAFLPRHGSDHRLPPHKINYLANIYAMKELGVKKIIGPCAAGSLTHEIKPGDIVICDDIVDRTEGRKSTFFEGPEIMHVHMSNAYCEDTRKYAVEAVKSQGIKCHEKGTVVVIKGPRFATRAESVSYIKNGWQVINMTQYPESYLAKEQNICYVNISLITDWDIGVGGVKESPVEEIFKTFEANNKRLKDVLYKLIEILPVDQEGCNCERTQEYSAIN